MEKKYQVFVSSTYVDLLEERKEVIQALLELDCIPVGMELFPASDDDQWSFIKSVIDDCDYYVLILAGRYGSCSETGVGYTEMEYRYALDTGKPIIAFLHEKPDELTVNKTDQDSELAAKLSAFRALAQKKLCKFWKTPTELGGVVGRSLVQLKKRSPAIGWVKANLVPDEDSTQEILRLKNQIDELKLDLENTASHSGVDVTELAQGEDIFNLEFAGKSGTYFERIENNYIKPYTWNTIFSVLAPALIDEESDRGLASKINGFLLKEHEQEIQSKGMGHFENPSCEIETSCFETIIVQLRALNLIEKSTRNRSVKDKATYWRLTSHGDHVMVGLRAIRKNQS